MALDRKWLYTKTVEKVTKAGKLIEFKKLYPSQDSWVTTRFKNETNTQITLDNSIKSKILSTNWTIEKFYKTFACDLDWAKSTQYCGGTGGNEEDPINWDTVTDAELIRRIKTGGEEFWKKIKKNIPSLIKKGGKWYYDTKEDLIAWWEKHKNDSIIHPPKPPRTDDGDNTESNGIYTTKGDPYQYKIVNCTWYTKSLIRKRRLKYIPDWISLEDNEKANGILDGRFPSARKNCNSSNTDTITASTVTASTVNDDTTPANLPQWAVCIKIIKNLKISQDSDGQEIVIAAFGNDLGFFWEDFTFLYVSKDGTKTYGKWSCKNNMLVITTEDGQVWTASSGWVTSPEKTRKPEQNFGTSWATPGELSGADEPEVKKSNPFSELSNFKFPEIKGYDITKPLNLNQNESTMDSLERVINEVNSLIIEQTQQVVQAPADELNTLETNSLLKNTGTLEALCRSNNGTSKPVNVNGKTYFAGKSFTLKTTGKPAYLTFDGMVLQRVGNTCNFTYVVDKDGNFMHIKGIPYADLAAQQTDILNKFGINPLDYNSDPYYFIKTITTKFQSLIDQKARSMVFKSWNDMLTYWDPKGTRLTGDETTMSYPPNDELNQYRLVTADNLGIKYLDKQVQIYVPLEAALVTGAKAIKYDEVSCQLELKTYLTAAFEFQMDGQDDPNINVNTVRQHLRGCYSHGMFDKDKFKGLQQADLNIQFSKENNPFKWWKQGSILSMNNIKELLTGSNKALPLVSGGRKNPYLNFNIDTMRESNVKLNNLIKENLQKLSEQKTNNLLAETKIIQTRTKIITENRILKFKQPREKFFSEVISEAIYLNSQGFDKKLIKEEFWESLKGLFGEHGSNAIFSTFKEYMGKHLVDKLTSINPNGWMGEKIKKAINDIHIEDLDKIVDCDFISKKISSSISDSIISKVSKNQDIENNDISSIVKDGLDKSIDRTELTKNIHKGVHKLICPVLGNISSKLKDKAQEMKSKAVQP